MAGRTFLPRAPWLAAAALATGIVTLAGPATALAARGYGAPPPSGTVPGGYHTVLTSQTITDKGGTIGPLTDGSLKVTLVVPPDAFTSSVQITLTSPDVSQIGSAGFTGYHAVGGLGVQVDKGSTAYSGTFAKPLSLGLAASSITSRSIVVNWSGSKFVKSATSTAVTGVATVTFSTDPDFAVLRSGSSVAGSTSAGTGEPFIGETLIALLLVLAGASGLFFARRHRAAV